MKRWSILGALALIACLMVIGLRRDDSVPRSIATTPQGPSFQLRVAKPRVARPLFGILPAELENRMAGGGDPEFDSASPGARAGSVGKHRLELEAHGWDFVMATARDGGVAPGTHLVFPLVLAGKQRRLHCRPADNAKGYLRMSARAGTNKVDGTFLVKLASCENVATGRTIEWPPAALTVRGNFVGLPATD